MGSVCAKDTSNVCDGGDRTRSGRYRVDSRFSDQQYPVRRSSNISSVSNACVPIPGLDFHQEESLSIPSVKKCSEITVRTGPPLQSQKRAEGATHNALNMRLECERLHRFGAKLMQPKLTTIQSPPLETYEENSDGITTSRNAIRPPNRHNNHKNNKNDGNDDSKKTKAEGENVNEPKRGENGDGSPTSSTASYSASYMRWPSVDPCASRGSSPHPLRPVQSSSRRKLMRQKQTPKRVALCDRVATTEAVERRAVADAEEGEWCVLVEQCVAARQCLLLQIPALHSGVAAAGFGVLSTLATERKKKKKKRFLDAISANLLGDGEASARATLNAAEDDEWNMLLERFAEAKQRIQQHIEQFKQQLDLHTQPQDQQQQEEDDWQTQDYWSQFGQLIAFKRRERWLIDGALASSSAASTVNGPDDGLNRSQVSCHLDCGRSAHMDAGPLVDAGERTAIGTSSTVNFRTPETGNVSLTTPGPRRRMPLESPAPDELSPWRSYLRSGLVESPAPHAGLSTPAAGPHPRQRWAHPALAAAPSEAIATSEWMLPLRHWRLRPQQSPPAHIGAETNGSLCSIRSCSSPQPQTPTGFVQDTTSGASNSTVRGGKRICRWCDEPYESRDVCLVARQLHSVMRQQRRVEKSIKKRAQALLREGHVQDAIRELRSAELI